MIRPLATLHTCAVASLLGLAGFQVGQWDAAQQRNRRRAAIYQRPRKRAAITQ